jgi:hypothetical protein
VAQIEPKSLDRSSDTWIRIGCHRETHRLDRVLECYQKALALADSRKLVDEFSSGIASMHDHKGWLTVEWNSAAAGRRLHSIVDEAWQDLTEHLVTHVTTTGEHVSGERK